MPADIGRTPVPLLLSRDARVGENAGHRGLGERLDRRRHRHAARRRRHHHRRERAHAADDVHDHGELGLPGRLRRPDPARGRGAWAIGGVISANSTLACSFGDNFYAEHPQSRHQRLRPRAACRTRRAEVAPDVQATMLDERAGRSAAPGWWRRWRTRRVVAWLYVDPAADDGAGHRRLRLDRRRLQDRPAGVRRRAAVLPRTISSSRRAPRSLRADPAERDPRRAVLHRLRVLPRGMGTALQRRRAVRTRAGGGRQGDRAGAERTAGRRRSRICRCTRPTSCAPSCSAA